MEDIVVPIVVIPSIVIALPWLIFHYVTKWKQAPRITDEDEKLLDELHYTARRLEDRMQTIERIIAADNPDFARPDLARPDFNRHASSTAESGYDLPRRN